MCLKRDWQTRHTRGGNLKKNKRKILKLAFFLGRDLGFLLFSWSTACSLFFLILTFFLVEMVESVFTFFYSWIFLFSLVGSVFSFFFSWIFLLFFLLLKSSFLNSNLRYAGNETRKIVSYRDGQHQRLADP